MGKNEIRSGMKTWKTQNIFLHLDFLIVKLSLCCLFVFQLLHPERWRPFF